MKGEKINCRPSHFHSSSSTSDYWLIMIFDELHKQIKVFLCVLVGVFYSHIEYLRILKSESRKKSVEKEMSKTLPSTINYHENKNIFLHLSQLFSWMKSQTIAHRPIRMKIYFLLGFFMNEIRMWLTDSCAH
jgi:hypothetical protein